MALLVVAGVLTGVYLGGALLISHFLKGFGVTGTARILLICRWPKVFYNPRGYFHDLLGSSGGAGISFEDEEPTESSPKPSVPFNKDLN